MSPHLSSAPLSCLDPSVPADEPAPSVRPVQQVVTLAIVLGPLLALAGVVLLWWDDAVNLNDVLIGVVSYLVTGFGVSAGYHRLFTHRSFKARRWVKVAFAVAGSMAVEGSVTSWVATHRRHHLFSDRAGDPHSPHRYGDQGTSLLRGLFFAHLGWLFMSDASDAARYAPDMVKDPDIRRIDRLFPLLALTSLAIPFAAGYALSGTAGGALSALVWGGLVRMALLHHVTWSVNSLCHTFGRRTDSTADRSTNLWVLAIPSFGDSWHNIHHAHPAWARHGARRGMLDPSARLIAMLQGVGWVTAVRWPEQALV